MPGGMPPFGPPSGQPGGMPPFGPPSGQPGGPPAGQMPMSAPPNFTPTRSGANWQHGSSGIQSCLFRNTFIWTFSGNDFWFFPISVTRDQLIGWRWSYRTFRWTFRTVTRHNIIGYQCFRF